MFEGIRNWFQYYNTIFELSKLSDRELIDLGLTRVEIPYIAMNRLRG
jgi:uncharacterized protein YjiS (DUF1127 family)